MDCRMDMLLTPPRTQIERDTIASDKGSYYVCQQQQATTNPTNFMSPQMKLQILPDNLPFYLTPIGTESKCSPDRFKPTPALTTLSRSTSLMFSESLTEEVQMTFESLSQSIDHHHRTHHINIYPDDSGNSMQTDNDLFLCAGESYTFAARSRPPAINRKRKRVNEASNAGAGQKCGMNDMHLNARWIYANDWKRIVLFGKSYTRL